VAVASGGASAAVARFGPPGVRGAAGLGILCAEVVSDPPTADRDSPRGSSTEASTSGRDGSPAAKGAMRRDPKRNEKPAPPEDDRSPLSMYFREMGAVDLMSPDQERAAATRITGLRQAYWRAIFDYPPFVEGIISVIEEMIDPDRRPLMELEALATASRKARDRETRSNKELFAISAQAAAVAMSMADPDGDASVVISTDLEAIMAGRIDRLTLRVTLPRRDSAPYARYVEAVRAASEALWREKNKFVRANLRLVVTMARRFNRGRMSLPDLIQEGNIGLMKAVDRFDPSRGFRFSTYGSWWIRHAISRALADKGREVRVPVHMLELHHKLSRVRRQFELTHGRGPNDEELAEIADVPLDKIHRMRQCLLDQGPSLDMPLSDEDGRTGADLLVDDRLPSPGDRLAVQALGDKVREFIGRLPPIEADVLRKRFGLDQDDPMTLREIGEQYQLSRERIRQLQEQALGRIRRELRRNDMI
jgi:RNA polymerase primary sigma factor